MTAGAPTDEKVKAFLKLLRSGGYEKSDREKFQDWCEAAYCAYARLSALAMGNNDRAEELEARYMHVVESYRDKTFIRTLWAPMKALCEEVLEQGGIDFLGMIAGELNALDGDKGQFFTPYTVSRMMADMQLSDMGSYIDKHGYFTLSEPAAGAGSMVVAAADSIRALGYDPMVSMLVEAWDIGYLTFLMCYLQLTWRGVTAKVVRGNTLSQEVFEEAWTPYVALFYGIHGSLFERKRDICDVLEEVIALERTPLPSEPIDIPPVVAPEPARPLDEPQPALVQLTLF